MKKQDFTVLKIADLHPFPDNPFRVAEDGQLAELAESIKEFGVVTPIITRPKEDGNGYEVIAGQRRVRASQLAGIETVPAFVLPLDRDRAIITLVDSNIQRENILPSEAVQNDGPNGFNSYTLGQYANTDTDSADPYVIDPDDKNLNYKFGTMSNETVIAQTFSKEMAAEYGAVTGNYSIWSNLPILWGAGTNLHRTPYNARNHEYYSEDAILTAYQAAAYIAAGKEYGCIIAPKHFAFNDTEINRSGIATFMTEQKARENELRGTQASVEDAQTLGMMTTFNRIGCTAGNAHYGLLMNILRKEWGFQGLMSEDFIQDANYSVLKEAVHCGVTMTCNTGDSNMEAVTAKWNYWTTEAVSKDASMMQDLKNVMMWQNYALANSNAMDGLNETSQIKDVRTWYDNALTATSAVLALLTLAAAAMYIRDAKRRKNS